MILSGVCYIITIQFHHNTVIIDIKQVVKNRIRPYLASTQIQSTCATTTHGLCITVKGEVKTENGFSEQKYH